MLVQKSKGHGRLETLYRCFFVYFAFTLTFFISGFIINFLQMLLYLAVRPYNVNLYRKINYYLCYSLYTQIMFLAEWYADADIFIYMDEKDRKYLGKEHAFIISNHKYEVDWIIIDMLSEKCNVVGNLKAYMKKALQYIPGLGWSFYFSENVLLQRSFDKDKEVIQKQVAKLLEYPSPIWLALYPEGTRYTRSKYEASLKVAKEKGLPQLKYHLTPRTKGFVTSLPPMKNKMGAIYDVTTTCDPDPDKEGTLENVLSGRKFEAHIYVRRIPFEDVPQDETKAAQFVHDMFVFKDKLQESFLTTGSYFATSGVKKVAARKMRKSWACFFSYISWATLVMGTIFYYLVKLLFTGSLYNICIVYGLLLLVSFGLSQFFKASQTEEASSRRTKAT